MTQLPPTRRMRDLARAIAALTARMGYPPTYRQLGDELGVGIARVRDLAKGARSRGLVEQDDGVGRSLRLHKTGRRVAGRA